MLCEIRLTADTSRILWGPLTGRGVSVCYRCYRFNGFGRELQAGPWSWGHIEHYKQTIMHQATRLTHYYSFDYPSPTYSFDYPLEES